MCIFLVGLVNAAAECVASLEDAYIACEESINCDFGIGKSIDNISIILSSKVGDNVGKSVVLSLYQSDKLLDRINVITDATGKATLICPSKSNCFDFTPERSGKFVLKAIIDPNGLNQAVEREINVKKSLDLTLNCPLQGFINRPVECTWTVADSETGILQSTLPKISVTQDGADLISIPATTSVSFTPEVVGSVEVSVEVEKEDYISDKDFTQIAINNPTVQVNFQVDGKDFTSYSSSGITTGTHKIKFIVQESGETVSVNKIKATMRTPASQEVPLVINKIGNDFETSFNFEQQGQTYNMKGEIIFTDVNKLNLPFEVALITSGEAVAKGAGVTALVIGAIIGVVIIFIIIIVIFILWRKK